MVWSAGLSVKFKKLLWSGVTRVYLAVKSIQRWAALGARGYEFESRQYQYFREKCAWKSLDKELTTNCLVDTRTKLKELISAAMAKHGLKRVQFLLWLQQSLMNGFSCMVYSWPTVVSEHL